LVEGDGDDVDEDGGATTPKVVANSNADGSGATSVMRQRRRQKTMRRL